MVVGRCYSRYGGMAIPPAYTTFGGVTFFLIAGAAAAAEEDLVTVEKEAAAFFESAEPGTVGRAVAGWRVPPLGRLPFVAVRRGEQRFPGWRLDADRVLVTAYELRHVRDGDRVEPAEPAAALARELEKEWPAAHALVAHWIAALRRGDDTNATRAWKAFRERYDRPTANAPRSLYAPVMFSWRSVWDDYTRPGLAKAALAAMESVAPDEAWRGVARRMRRGVRATPATIPEPPPEDAPPRRQAEVYVRRLRDLEPMTTILPPGSMIFSRDNAARRLRDLGRPAFPALVATLEHEGLTDAWHGNSGWQEYLTYGAVAGRILHDRLGFLDDAKTMRAWIASGKWPDEAATRAWFAEHGSSEQVREAAAGGAEK